MNEEGLLDSLQASAISNSTEKERREANDGFRKEVL